MRPPPLAWAFHSTTFTSSALPYSNFGLLCAAAARATRIRQSAARARRRRRWKCRCMRGTLPLCAPGPEGIKQRRAQQRVRKQVPHAAVGSEDLRGVVERLAPLDDAALGQLVDAVHDELQQEERQ